MTAGSAIIVERATADDLKDLLPLMRESYAGERLPFDEAVLRRALAEIWREPLHGAVLAGARRALAVGYAVLCCGFSLEYRGSRRVRRRAVRATGAAQRGNRRASSMRWRGRAANRESKLSTSKWTTTTRTEGACTCAAVSSITIATL